MDTYEAILSRRSIPKTGEGVPSKSEIERLLQAAIAAPNHHLTEPWRFIVLAGDALKDLGEAFAQHAQRTGGRPELARDLPLRAPAIITVVQKPFTPHGHVPESDDDYAIGAAIQNILLAAHNDGLVAMIRTGAQVSASEVSDHLGLNEGERVAGFIYVGYPSPGYTRKPPRKTPVEQLTEWRGM